MGFDIYSTAYLEAVIKEKPQVYTFLRDRYFGERDVFKTEKVFLDYVDGEGNVLAPFVVPEVGKVPMGRSGYETFELTPAYIAPSRVLTVNDLAKRRAGEALDSAKTPEQREREYLVEDLDFLDKAITRREEWMCAETMLNNECRMEHIGDKADKAEAIIAKYYDGANEGVFTPSAKWEVGTATKRGTWYTDVCKQIESMTAAGREVSDLVVGGEVAQLILNDPWVMQMLDNRRVELGKVDPRWQGNGVTRLGILNFDGVDLTIFAYRGTYQSKDSKGKLTTKLYFPSTGALLASPATGKLRYGAVNQMEKDGHFHTRTGMRVPKYNANIESNIEETILTSRPVAAPKMKGQWRACKDVLSGS